MAEIKVYDVWFKRGNDLMTCRRVQAYDAADALVQAKVMIDHDSRLDATALGPLHGSHVAALEPVEPPQ